MSPSFNIARDREVLEVVGYDLDPFFKLHGDDIFEIFNMLTCPYQSDNSDEAPLVVLRRCSQVCRLWREFIINCIPGVWGNCVDFDSFCTNNPWRYEVLRRTGTSNLALRSRRLFTLTAKDDRLDEQKEFAIQTIANNWERAWVVDLTIGSKELLNDRRIQNAFCSPAPALTMFAITYDSTSPMAFDILHALRTRQLFDTNKAPSLSHFYLYVNDIHNFTAYGHQFTFPSFLFTRQLQVLKVEHAIIITDRELVDACAQMPLIEELSLFIKVLIITDPRNRRRSTSLLPPVYLPSLNFLRIQSFGLDIFPGFLTLVNAHPSQVAILVHSMPQYSPDMLDTFIDELPRIILLDVENFVANHFATGEHQLQVLALNFPYSGIHLDSHRNPKASRCNFEVSFRFKHPLVSAIQDRLISFLLSLRLRPIQFRFEAPTPEDVQYRYLAPLFRSLGSTTNLRTSMRGLSYIVELSESEGVVLFESVVRLELGINNDINPVHIHSFLASRQDVQVLHIGWWCGTPLGDLRFLEEIDGLLVTWIGNNEYFCGSGDPDQLLFTN